MKRVLLTFFLLVGFIGIMSATHNRAGEFKIEQIGDLTIRLTVITYTKTSSSQADRDSLVIHWGDGSHAGCKEIKWQWT